MFLYQENVHRNFSFQLLDHIAVYIFKTQNDIAIRHINMGICIESSERVRDFEL